MDSSIKPLRKEILELIASSETITECVFPPMYTAAHLPTMNFSCRFVQVFDDMRRGLHSCKFACPVRLNSQAGCSEL